MNGDEEILLSEVTAFEDRRYEAMVRCDIGYLSTIFGDGLIYTHSSGVRQDGAEYLRGLKAGADIYRKIDHGIDLTVRLGECWSMAGSG